jgi:hypothetical protein
MEVEQAPRKRLTPFAGGSLHDHSRGHSVVVQLCATKRVRIFRCALCAS